MTREGNCITHLADEMRGMRENRVVLEAIIRRNLVGRFKGSYLGFVWHIIMPVLMIVVLYIVFGSIRTKPVENFWVYLSAGMFPMMFLSGCLRGRALQANSRYITGMRIPRSTVVLSSVITDFIGVIFAYVFIIMVILLSGQHVNWFGMAMLPVELFLMFMFGLGCSLLVSTMTVFVGDIGNALNIAMRLVFWITPTFFLVGEASGLLGAIIWYNPLTYYVETFHQILYYGMFPDTILIVASVVLSAAMLLIGWWAFDRKQARFPEVL